MAEIVETVPFNFDDIYATLQTKFSDRGYDIADGSNTSQLITAMAYLTSMLNTNTAININETLLPLATKRSNVLQASRVLGYQPSQKISYVYNIQLELALGYFVLPKYTQFSSNGFTYYYIGSEIAKTVTQDDIDAGTNFINIDIKEGTLLRYNTEALLATLITADSNGAPLPYIDIPYTDIEEDGIEVFTQYAENNVLINDQWSKATTSSLDFDLDLYATKQFVRIDNIEFGTARIYFKVGDVGKTLPVGSIVNINILQTNGASGIVDGTPTSTQLIGATIVDGSEQLITQGADYESIASIKENAPLFHNSANRAVTKSDYLAICNRHQSVKDTYVWDGNDDFYKIPGNIWLSFTPNTLLRSFSQDEFNKQYTLNLPNDSINWYLEDRLIAKEVSTDNDGVFDYLDNFAIPSLKFRHRHPIYFDFNFDVKISKYSLITPKTTINDNVFNIINDYFIGDEYKSIEQFDSEYFESSLLKRVAASEYLSDVSGVDITTTNRVSILDKHFNVEEYSYFDTSFGLKRCFVPLSYPYEGLFDDNDNLILENLPDITTAMVDTNYGDLIKSIDLKVVYKQVAKSELITFQIMLDGYPVGLYNIVSTLDNSYVFLEFLGVETNITTIPYINAETSGSSYFKIGDGTRIGYYFPNVLSASVNNLVDGGVRCGDVLNTTIVGGSNAINLSLFKRLTFDVKYPSNNIKFIRNVIPRLNKVTFS